MASPLLRGGDAALTPMHRGAAFVVNDAHADCAAKRPLVTEAARLQQYSGSGPAGALPWLAILGACLCFGTFTVPMKGRAVVDANVHPIVYQCYKTWWTFLSSSLVLLVLPCEFTWWGLASGFSWVPAGVAAVVAVRHLGIARGQAIWQATIIWTSFMWGFVILQDEPVHNVWRTASSLLLLTAGVLGMTLSFKAHPRAADVLLRQAPSCTSSADLSAPLPSDGGSSEARGAREMPCYDLEGTSHSTSALSPGPSWSLGLAAALFNGVWGGANLVPSHFAPVHGVHFVFSFGVGAMVANVVLLASYVAWIKLWGDGRAVPSPEFRVMALPGFISGTLWSMGNFCALYAVSTLGQAVGYSLVQCSVVVSGLWGVLYYRELTGLSVLYWWLSCAVCGTGVMGLALETGP